MNVQAQNGDLKAAGNGKPTARCTVTVTNPQGLHMRPADVFARLARQFSGQVLVNRLDRSVNGKSQLDLLMLAAEPGAELEIVVVGDDAETALTQLAEVLASPECNDGPTDPGGETF